MPNTPDAQAADRVTQAVERLKAILSGADLFIDGRSVEVGTREIETVLQSLRDVCAERDALRAHVVSAKDLLQSIKDRGGWVYHEPERDYSAEDFLKGVWRDSSWLLEKLP